MFFITPEMLHLKEQKVIRRSFQGQQGFISMSTLMYVYLSFLSISYNLLLFL